MVNLNTNINMSLQSISSPWESNPAQKGGSFDSVGTAKIGSSDEEKTQFASVIKNYLSNVDDLQQSSDMSIQDLLSGKNEDIASVASAAAKADVSFKLLVGVRNKLIEAYRQTMNMPL